MQNSDLCDYNDAYIAVKEIITVAGTNVNNRTNKELTFKNSAPSKINNTFTDNAEDLDTVMSIYSLLESSDNHSMTSENLWNYYKVEMNDGANAN